MAKRKISLRLALLATIVVCWLVPIISIMEDVAKELER